MYWNKYRSRSNKPINFFNEYFILKHFLFGNLSLNVFRDSTLTTIVYRGVHHYKIPKGDNVKEDNIKGGGEADNLYGKISNGRVVPGVPNLG